MTGFRAGLRASASILLLALTVAALGAFVSNPAEQSGKHLVVLALMFAGTMWAFSSPPDPGRRSRTARQQTRRRH